LIGEVNIFSTTLDYEKNFGCLSQFLITEFHGESLPTYLLLFVSLFLDSELSFGFGVKNIFLT
jgi:hypothetical protein